jgi:predicted ArsR family transcriptional regulator
MQDEFQKQFRWIGDMLKRPVRDFLEPGSQEYAIVASFKEGWGKRDTAELLRELTAQYGDAAGRSVEEYIKLNILDDWPEIGKKEAHEGTEIEDFVRVLWSHLEELGFEYGVENASGRVTFCVTKCPHHELAKQTGLHDWLYHFACAGDFHMPGAFSPKIRFARTKTLMQGQECCNHQYYYEERR